MQAVSITGYFATGSGAAYNLLQEYDTISDGGLTSFEHIILYSINGVFDTVDRILYRNRLYNSNAAIDLFRKEMNRLYNTDYNWFGGYKYRCGEKFLEIIEDFIGDITEFYSDFDWYGKYDKRAVCAQRIIRDSAAVFLRRRKIDHNFGKTIIMDDRNQGEYSFATKEKLQDAVKKLIKNYISLMYPEYKKKTVIINHLLQPFDTWRLNSYVPDGVKMIIVDRDIRDLYVTNKYTNLWAGGCPFPKDLNGFIEFTKAYRGTEKKVEDPNVLRIRFEELIYLYDSTVKKFESFLGLSQKDHTMKYRYLNPEKSIKNTQIFCSNSKWSEEIIALEREFPDLLFDFPYKNNTSVEELFDA